MRRSALRHHHIARAANSQRSFIVTSKALRPDLISTPESNSHPSTVLSSSSTRAIPPFRFETGLALFAKRAPRPFPPPFLSPPSGSFSDPLSTHNRSRDRRAFVNGELIRGHTNGDDAVYASNCFIGANDGVGAWSTREGGHAGLWSRLILHFWALEVEQDASRQRSPGEEYTPTPIAYLQRAYEHTIAATSEPTKWQGTTTASGAQLHFRDSKEEPMGKQPVLYVTNLGDSQILVLRPSEKKVLFKTTEQWHWFDCPRQLGTNSPDTPNDNAKVDEVLIQENDIVLAMSDGVIDNLWEHEIVESVVNSLAKWEEGKVEGTMNIRGDKTGGAAGGMRFVAENLMNAARVIAQDPFAESPFMEHAVEEGLAMEGGKLDDISVVAALCRRNNG